MSLHVPEFESRLQIMIERDLGNEILEFLASKNTEDILCNADGGLYTFSEGKFHCQGQLDQIQIFNIIKSVASSNDAEVNEDHPILEAIIPIKKYGYPRFEGTVPPISQGPAFAIRKRPSRVYSLDDFIESGVLTRNHGQCIKEAVKHKKHIVIGGPTGSGKTTLVNATVHAIGQLCPNDRLVLIEDTTELQCPVKNHLALLAAGEITMQKCLEASMRLKPTRIIVGEIRGKEALTLVMAWNTGHRGGVTTIHADNAIDALVRLEMLVSMATPAALQRVIAETIGLVVVIKEDQSIPAGRKVCEVARVKGYENGRYLVEQL